MAFESVNVSALKGELYDLNNKIPSLQKGVIAPFEDLSENSWKSSVRISTIDKISKIAERYEELKGSVSAYLGVVGLIGQYKEKQQAYNGAYAQYKVYKAQYEAHCDEEYSFGDYFARWYYGSLMNSQLNYANRIKSEMESLRSQISGASI